jgi:DNA-binding transcriptional LysR family regulator
MHTDEPGWELYRSFLGVLRNSSLSAAARALGLTQPTVGRHIDALEHALGAPLFLRSVHGLSPTELAEQLRPHAESLAAAAAALHRTASAPRDAVYGTVRITASDMVGAEVLPPILAALRAAHPGIVVELVLSNDVADLLRRDADIAVRMVRPTQESLVAKLIGEIALGLFAHRDYLAAHGQPETVADLAKHALIGYDTETAFIRRVRDGGVPVSREMFSVRCDNDLAQFAALRAGCGIGVCQVALARRDPALVRVLPDALRLNLPTWLAMHADLRGNRRCRLTFDALADGLARYIASQTVDVGAGQGMSHP